MVLPETWFSAVVLLIVSTFCFVIWPNLFKVAGIEWRFELFSLDFALGALAAAVIAAFTLGTFGSDLGFSDSMLVAGRRAQAMAIGAGVVFTLGNMLYLGTIALLGLTNATLLTFSVLGCAVEILQLLRGQFLTAGSALALLVLASSLTFLSAKAARQAVTRKAKLSSQMSLSTKGTITGVLAGLALGGVVPVLQLAQTDEFGIGAYGGVLMAAIGIAIATFLLNFFFMSISLEGGRVRYVDYLAGTFKNHAVGAFCGVVWTIGALALYTAKTGPAKASAFEAWTAVFAGALITIVSGIVVWQKVQLPSAATRNKFFALALFVAGTGVLLFGLR